MLSIIARTNLGSNFRYFSTNSVLDKYVAVNEPLLQYKPGSAERNELEQALQDQKLTTIPIVIGNEEIVNADLHDQVSPFDHKHSIARYSYATKSQLKQAIEVGLKARHAWSRQPWEARAEVMLRAADLMAGKYRSSLLAATMLGQAKTIYQAEIDAAAELVDFLRFNVQHMALLSQYSPVSTADATNTMKLRPTEGFWAAVSPFNFTAIGGHLAAAPAFMGNTVLWKPSDTAMLSNYVAFQALREAGLPAGVINFVPADGPTFGDAVTNSADLAGINFTGSVATFRTLVKQVGQNIEQYKTFPRLIGECGGKNFHFVHKSADPEVVAVSTLRAAFEFSGQKCSACSRMFVPSNLWPQIQKSLRAHMKQIRMGSPLQTDTLVSAVIDKKAFDRVKSYVDHAKSSPSIDILEGGNCDDSKGYFIEPTLVQAHDPMDPIMKEEIFGPLVAVYVYDENTGLNEAMELADKSTSFALTGAIFAQDEAFLKSAQEHFADSCGNLYINNPSTGSVVNQQPFGGARLSGTNDKAGGPHYLLRFASAQALKTQHKPILDWRQAHMC